jgi:uncharacterized protein (DUF433 family)
MIDWSNCPVLESAQDRVSGPLVFAGSRVPISALFKNFKDGVTANTEIFPGVRLEQVRAVLDFAAKNPLTFA